MIGTPTKSTSPPGDDSKDLESVSAKLQDELSRVNIHENQNVIIAQHIRVPEADRYRLTFGSFGVDFDSSLNSGSGFQAVGASEESNGESAARFVFCLVVNCLWLMAKKLVHTLEKFVPA